MAPAKEAPKKGGDPLKSYTIVMGLLVLIMGGLYLAIDGGRKRYETANASLKRRMNLNASTERTSATPTTFPDLSVAVRKLSRRYEQAAGGGVLERRIERQAMLEAANAVQLRQTEAGSEGDDSGPGYIDKWMKFSYASLSDGPPEIWQFLGLLWNIERTGRYRVSELYWEVAEPTANPQAPFSRIKKNNSIKVTLRLAE